MSTVKIKKMMPLVLSITASLGVIATAVATTSATAKAVRKIDQRKEETGESLSNEEVIKTVWKCYIPTVAIGASTIVCVVMANAVSQHNQKTLISAYTLLERSFTQYKGKLKELYGEEAHNEIINSIVKDECKETLLTAYGGFTGTTLEWDSAEKEKTRTFYDTYSKRYFESTISQVLQAEYHFNRNFVLSGEQSVNQLYEFLGLDLIEGGDDVGWNCCDYEIAWVDFDHHTTVLDDGMEILVIDTPLYPTVLGQTEY